MHIYMTRHGESINNINNVIGGDCHISERGQTYSNFLSDYFSSLNSEVTVWTSELKRTKETAANISSPGMHWKPLNEIDAGDFDGLVLDNIMADYPELYRSRNNDKLNKSYPNGESYLDLQKRVIKILTKIDMTQNGTLLIVAHQAVCRVIYSYFTKTPLSECINTAIDLHTIYKLSNNKFIPIRSYL